MKEAFVISPIGMPESLERKHADDVFDFIIRPAMSCCGYAATRADQVTTPGRISDQIFRRILGSDLCIAVLTFGNPNVYYELAVAHAFNKATILLLAEGEHLPFDVNTTAPDRLKRGMCGCR